MKLEHFSNTIHKNKLKWIKDLNVKPETTKLLEVNIGRTLFDINNSKILFDLRPPGGTSGKEPTCKYRRCK